MVQALRGIDSSIRDDMLAVTEDPANGLALSLQGVNVTFHPGNPFDGPLILAFVLSFGAGTFSGGCKVTGWLRMGNGEAPSPGHDKGKRPQAMAF